MVEYINADQLSPSFFACNSAADPYLTVSVAFT